MQIDFVTHSDSDFIRQFIYQTVTGPTPIDLTGSSIEMMIRRKASDASVFIELSTGNGLIQITSAVAGTFTVRIPFANLERLPAGVYDQSCIRTRPDTFREEIWFGTLTHSVGPTR